MTGNKNMSKKQPDQEDVFQALLIADNFENYLLGENCPYVPESLITLANHKLIDYALEALTASGVNEIFVYCSRNYQELKSYINSKWSILPHTITVITSEDSLSLGDALRDLDKKAILRNDFILMQPGVVTNVELRPLLEKHRETVKADKGAVMTLVHRKMSHGHRSRPNRSNSVVVVDSKTSKIITYIVNLTGKKFTMPLESMQPEMDMYLDSCDTGIAICSSCVPPLFVDNFDFCDMNDFIRGILINEEIMGNTLYLHRIEEGYANRAVDFNTYKGICMDVLQRWTYPLVPDMPFGAGPDSENKPFHYSFTYKGHNIKMGQGADVAPLTLIGHSSQIGKMSSIHHSCLGDNCTIGANVKLEDCFIGNKVEIGDGCIISECIITDNTVIQEGTDIKPWSLIDGTKITRIELPTEEEPDGSSDSSDNLDGPTDEPGTGDFERFSTEVLESLHRGFYEDVATENLILEINSSKFAYNITFTEVTTALTKGVLTLPTKFEPELDDSAKDKNIWEKTKECIAKFKTLIQHYVKTEQAQHDFLNAIEEYADDNKYFQQIIMQAIHHLYDEDLLVEDIILDWHKNQSLYEAGAVIRQNVSKFIHWLEVAESEDDDD